MQTIKCVAVGDGDQKRELMITYTEGKFPEEYVPTLIERPFVNVPIGGERYTLHLWDTTTHEDHAWMRPKWSYPDTDVFLFCFSIVAPTSFENVREKVT